MMRTLAITALFGLAPRLAVAQEVEHDEAGREIRYEQRQEIREEDWNAVNIDGELVRPEIKIIAGRPAGAFTPFIRLRQEFSVEMKASIDEVK